MIRQKYSNGRWIGLTLSECPGCLSYFHFAPFAFVMMIILCSIFAAFGFPILLYTLLIIYGMFDVVNSVGCFTMKNLQPQFVFLPIIFPLLHISYGIGTIVGLIQIPFWQKKIKNSSAKAHIEKVKRKIAKNTIHGSEVWPENFAAKARWYNVWKCKIKQRAFAWASAQTAWYAGLF